MQIVDRKTHKARTLIALARTIVSHRRLPMNDRLLATILATVAGAVNAGGFFVVGQYTSHMTGYLSQVADTLVVGHFGVAIASASAIAAFIVGAAISAFLVNWARQHHYHRQYALPIAVQGGMLFLLSFAGRTLTVVPTFALLLVLCVLMGMQNATITKISKARIRTTHATGMITDIGIELGRAVFGRYARSSGVKADRHKFSTLLQLVLAYLAGGIVGAIGFATAGFAMALPLSCVLLAIALPTLLASRSNNME